MSNSSGCESRPAIGGNWIIGSYPENFSATHPGSDFINRPELFVPSKPADYAIWLKGYLIRGGRVAAFRGEVWVDPLVWRQLYATADFTLDGEYAAHSQDIIVGPGVTQRGDMGGNTLYRFDDYTTNNEYVVAYATPETSALVGLDILAPQFYDCLRRDLRNGYRNPRSIPPQEVMEEYAAMAASLEFELVETEQLALFREARQ